MERVNAPRGILVVDTDNKTFFAVLPCIVCGEGFRCNPKNVPSVRHPDTGQKEAVCKRCIIEANVVRKENGFEPLEILDDAYEDGEGFPGGV